MLNHPNASDELRRETEAKMLQMKQRHLFALPATDNAKQKARLALEVEDLINGIVLLKISNELAWALLLENKDAEHIGMSSSDL